MRENLPHPAYWIVWLLSRWWFGTFYGYEAFGAHRVPRQGGFVLASNHVSFFDPPAVGAGFPRPIFYFARKTLFKGVFSWILPRLNAVPVDRDGESDIGALRAVFRILRSGEGLLFFPEGTRSPDGSIRAARRGVGMVACKAGVPVVPARIFGSFESFPRHRKLPGPGPRIRIVYGPALEVAAFDPGQSDPDRYQTAAERILEAIRQLPDPEITVI